jgi:hypothetical protein
MADFDLTSAIRSFLTGHPGPHCVACLTKATRFEARAVQAAFKPSKSLPYSYMPATCGDCGASTVCVAYVGEMSPAERVGKAAGGIATPKKGATGTSPRFPVAIDYVPQNVR